MAKIGRNDPCPCGSGKKYKNCCGKSDPGLNKFITNSSDSSVPKRSDLIFEDFVIDNLCKDINFLANAIQLILGPYGYNFCEEHKEQLAEDHRRNSLETFIANDALEVYSTSEAIDNSISRVRPYSGGGLSENNDIISLLRKGFISVDGYQVDLFHRYLMNNLKKRFKDYYYLPSESVLEIEKTNRRSYGSFARRGYDFLVGITLYLELQLGVHVFYNLVLPEDGPQAEQIRTFKESAALYYGFVDEKNDLSSGMAYFLIHYIDVIMNVEREYDPIQEVEDYNNIGAYTDAEYQQRKAIVQPGFFAEPLDYNYIDYLKHLVMATITNNLSHYTAANLSFPQCDFIRYLFGLENVIELFEDRVTGRKISAETTPEIVKDILQKSGNEISDIEISRKEIYDETVFLWMDEKDSMVNHIKPEELKYIDFPDDINDDERKTHDGMHNVNPARNNGNIRPQRKIRMELYNLINGKFFTLRQGDAPGSLENLSFAGKYPILPWISRGDEDTIHIKPFDKTAKDFRQIDFISLEKRQEYLTLEYRLTSIPANSVEKYLDPEAFELWEERNDLLKKLQERNKELERTNENLNKQIETNRKLVRNIAHSAANYLNSERLEKTGTLLHGAEIGDPTIDELHSDGLFLMLQSEQERYLTRQLKGLVGRYQSNMSEDEKRKKADSLEDEIKSSISRTDGMEIDETIEYALKTVAARVLFSKSDGKGKLIRSKLKKTDNEWTNITSSFITDVLAGDESCGGEAGGPVAGRTAAGGAVLNWWTSNWTELETDISGIWKKIRIRKNGAFYDLVSEITTELLINALAHGKTDERIKLVLDQETNERGRPMWAYVSCRNTVDEAGESGSGVGLASLESDISIVNRGKRAIECKTEEGIFETKVWLDYRLFLAKG